ncbi:MAG: TolC family protein, partial [Phycisphaerales bacterium]
GDADAQLESLLLEAAAVAVSTAVEVRAAYVACAAAQEVELLTRRDAEVAGRVLLAAQAALEEGEANASAVNEARMNAAEASNRAMESMLELVSAKTRLLEAIGRGDAGLAWQVASGSARAAREACAVVEPPVPEDDDALRRLVAERRLDLRAAEARVAAAEARLALAVVSRAPSVMLGAGWERDMEDDQAVMLQAQVSVPIFNDGRFRVQAAERDVELARLDADALRQRAVADARRALAAVDATSHHEAMLRGTTLASYESNKAILQAAVAEGDRPAIALWRSEHQVNHIRIQLARAERDRTLAALGFERALAGGRLPSMGGSAPMSAPETMGMGMGGLGAAQPLDFAGLETMQ